MAHDGSGQDYKNSSGSETAMTREAAMQKAHDMGLVGIHRMGDGGFMPGSSHSAYQAALDRAQEEGRA